MTVRELIDELRGFPPDHEVYLRLHDSHEGSFSEVAEIRAITDKEAERDGAIDPPAVLID